MQPRPRHRYPYALLRSIGEGGYAEVFRARRREAGGPDPVAFKRAKDFEDAVLRMAREIDVLRQLDHPNVMPILEASPNGDWFVMPLADGNLYDLWSGGGLGADAEAVVVDLVRQAGAGLGAAHDLRHVHRDVSPANILRLSDEGGERWVVSDWGLVRRPGGQSSDRMTGTGEGLGTRGFAAPETWSDAHRVDARADVYSLGRVAAWLLTGRWPQQNQELLPDGRLRGLVYESTQPDPARRPRTVDDLLALLERLLRDPPATPRRRVHDLLDADAGPAGVDGAVAVALANQDDQALFIDELAAIPPEAVEALARRDPDGAAATAFAMMRHLADRQLDFGRLDPPLRYAFAVTRAAVEGSDPRAEDLAAEFFRAESYWDQWRQMRVTVAWLVGLRPPGGDVVARALRRAGAQAYYAREVGQRRVACDSLAAELGR
ncbi:MAG: serine/threonine-protein kinase [Chloroflexota bacterium]